MQEKSPKKCYLENLKGKNKMEGLSEGILASLGVGFILGAAMTAFLNREENEKYEEDEE